MDSPPEPAGVFDRAKRLLPMVAAANALGGCVVAVLGYQWGVDAVWIVLILWLGPMSAVETFWPESGRWMSALAAVGFTATGAIYGARCGIALTSVALLAFGIFYAAFAMAQFRALARRETQSAIEI